MPEAKTTPLAVRPGRGGSAVPAGQCLAVAATSEFSLIGDNISELVLGREGGVQTLAFLVCGLGTAGLAIVLRMFTRGLSSSAVMSTLLLLNGLGLVVAGLVPTDRIDSPADMLTLSSGGLVHLAAAFVGLVSAVLAMFVGSWVFGRDCDWHPLVLWSVLLAGGSLALLFAADSGPAGRAPAAGPGHSGIRMDDHGGGPGPRDGGSPSAGLPGDPALTARLLDRLRQLHHEASPTAGTWLDPRGAAVSRGVLGDQRQPQTAAVVGAAPAAVARARTVRRCAPGVTPALPGRRRRPPPGPGRPGAARRPGPGRPRACRRCRAGCGPPGRGVVDRRRPARARARRSRSNRRLCPRPRPAPARPDRRFRSCPASRPADRRGRSPAGPRPSAGNGRPRPAAARGPGARDRPARRAGVATRRRHSPWSSAGSAARGSRPRRTVRPAAPWPPAPQRSG